MDNRIIFKVVVTEGAYGPLGQSEPHTVVEIMDATGGDFRLGASWHPGHDLNRATILQSISDLGQSSVGWK